MITDGRHLWNAGKIPLIAPELLTEILATAFDIAVLVDRSRRVVSVLVNPHHRAFGPLTDWQGAPLHSLLTEESRRQFDLQVGDIGKPGRGALAVDLNHLDRTNWEFPVRYSLHHITQDDKGLAQHVGRPLQVGRTPRAVRQSVSRS